MLLDFYVELVDLLVYSIVLGELVCLWCNEIKFEDWLVIVCELCVVGKDV